MSTLQYKKCPSYRMLQGGQACNDSQVLDIESRNHNTFPLTCIRSSLPSTSRFSILRPRHTRHTILDDIVPEDIYYERQVGVLCQIHSLHALFGEPLINWRDINAYIEELTHKNPLLQHSIGPNGYSDDAINLYLKGYATPSIHMAAPTGRIRLGTEKSTILSQLPERCDCFILVIEKKASHGRSDSGYLHATCMKFSHSQQRWFFIDSENSGPAVMQDEDWKQIQGDIKVPYLTNSGISHYGNRCHWLDLQQCSLSIARHTRTSANTTTRLPRHDWGQDARTSLIDPLHSTQCCSKPDAAVAVCSASSAKSEKGTAAVDNQAAHNQDDWQTQGRSKRPRRANNPIVPAPTRKQTLTLMDLWGKKKDKTDQTKKATGADTDEPEREFQGRIPAREG